MKCEMGSDLNEFGSKKGLNGGDTYEAVEAGVC